VADRNNKRIEVFRKDGSFLRQFAVPAQPRGVALDHRGNLVVVCSDNVVRIYNHEGKAVHRYILHSILGVTTQLTPQQKALARKEQLQDNSLIHGALPLIRTSMFMLLTIRITGNDI